jgi:hypothetical protein
MVRIVSPFESCSDDSRNERLRFLKFNMEHCEMYFQRAHQDTPDGVTVLLIDCCDPVGRMIAERLAGEERIKQVVMDCKSRNVMPTLHASIPTPNALLILAGVSPSLADAVSRCPEDCFPIWVVSAGGSSIAYRERPAFTPEFSC